MLILLDLRTRAANPLLGTNYRQKFIKYQGLKLALIFGPTISPTLGARYAVCRPIPLALYCDQSGRTSSGREPQAEQGRRRFKEGTSTDPESPHHIDACPAATGTCDINRANAEATHVCQVHRPAGVFGSHGSC